MTILLLILALLAVLWFAATYRALHDDRGTPPRSHPDDTFSPERQVL